MSEKFEKADKTQGWKGYRKTSITQKQFISTHKLGKRGKVVSEKVTWSKHERKELHTHIDTSI